MFATKCGEFHTKDLDFYTQDILIELWPLKAPQRFGLSARMSHSEMRGKARFDLGVYAKG